jgi:hypothetical protein
MNVVTELLADKRKLNIALDGLKNLKGITYYAACNKRDAKTAGEIWQAVCKVINDVRKG